MPLLPLRGKRVSGMYVYVTIYRYRQHEEEEIRKAFGSSPRMGLQLALRSATGGVVSLSDPVYVA
jgi:hypothetical protein